MDLVTAGEFVALVVGVGGAGAVMVKGGQALRRFGHFIDKLAGDGDKEPGILARLETLKGDAEDLKATAVERDQRLDNLTAAVLDLAQKIDTHVDGDAKTWLADGKAWGERLDGQVDNLDQRVTRLELTTSTDDPVVAPPETR